MLDNEPLQKSDRISIETTDEYSKLTLKNALLDDSGVYTICAENVVGRAEADFDVKVKGMLEFLHSEIDRLKRLVSKAKSLMSVFQ